MKPGTAAVLAIAAGVAFGLRLSAEEVRTIGTNNPPEPSMEFRVVMNSASWNPTRRLSANYEFSIKEKIKGEPPVSLAFRLYQGSDVDLQGRDSITRLNTYFAAGATNPWDPHGQPMTIQNSNTVH